MAPPKSPPAVVWCDRRTVVGLAWLIGFCLFFFSYSLPNNQSGEETRWAIWPVVPDRLLEIVFPGKEFDKPSDPLAGLIERLPAIGAALLMFGAASGIGHVALRRLKLDAQWTLPEQVYFAGGIGLSLGSLIILGLGLAGLLSPALLWGLVIAGNATQGWSIGRTWQKKGSLPRSAAKATTLAPADEQPVPRGLIIAAAVICLPLLWAMLLGALTPQNDFDVVAYHLNGPKEWFLQSRISFLPHNIYTSFPFLTEMWLLAGMVLFHDWSYGALAGQAVLMMFAPLTALGLYAAGRRWFSPSAGLIAAIVFLTTPWTYRVSVIAYAEGGITFYLFAAFFAAMIAEQMSNDETRMSKADKSLSFLSFFSSFVIRHSTFLLSGFLAGSAMACKYPGLTSVVLPVGLGISAAPFLKRRIPDETVPPAPTNPLHDAGRALLIYGLGVIIAIGPWLAKNLAETGNPVYPLAYSVFGGKDITPEANAKWRNGHKAAAYPSISARLRDSVIKLTDVVANNDWHSPLLYGLAPLAFFWRSRRTAVIATWLFALWLFLTWFLFTHHIDRFWIPMIPVIAFLAGAGGAALTTSVGRWIGGAIVAAAIAYNITLSSYIGGYNAGLIPLKLATENAAQHSSAPEIEWLNREWEQGRLSADFQVLFVGQAATFPARFPALYNTVFDQSLLEEWCAAGGSPDFPLKPSEQILQEFRAHGVTHLYVDWSWILRYREPYNYGYTDFVTPARLNQLQELGILDRPLRLPFPVGTRSLSDTVKQQLIDWHATELISRNIDPPSYQAIQIFPVRALTPTK